ncbi:hypothetical protein GCM10010249_38570 [Streptomyces roseolilacinus]|uniref:Fe/B12 periplasmic-binding domain-containing protein n=1 Tax=Streptomyces roseolilacinus TaxID=66904 RepID=A0A918B1X4_9ACTN|nr:hypothetical protein GCM10010249_38570 [Streptomyces roseolilacinus]
MSVRSVRRRRATAAVVALAAALSLAACGSQDGNGAGGTGDGAADKRSVAQGGQGFGGARAKTAALGTDAEPGRFPRTLTHAMGETEIKAAPRRVVVLDVGELDNVVSLGVKPVGYAPAEGDPDLPAHLAKDGGSPRASAPSTASTRRPSPT